MTFYTPLSHKEKWYIARFAELSHADVARSLNRLFKSTNNGTRSRMCIYLFRQTEEYRLLRDKAIQQEQKDAAVRAEA